MTSSTDSQPSYYTDAETRTELARLIREDRMLTSHMGALLPEMDVTSMRTVLDIACGPGGWALDVAAAYPHLHVIGIDNSQQMIKYAKMLAVAEKVSNVEFLEMDAVVPLKFPDATFDFINARSLHTFMSRELWPVLLQDWYRLLRSGGIARSTELESGFASSPELDKMNIIFAIGLYRGGMGFSPVGHGLGITPRLRRLFAGAGFQSIKHQAHALDLSYGSEGYEGWVEELVMLYHMLSPFLVGMEVTTQQEQEQLFEETMKAIRSPDFCALAYLLSVWGVKP